MCNTVNDGYYDTVCTTSTTTSQGSTTGVAGGSGDGCQYKWEGKGENMKWVVIPGSCNNARFGLGVNAGVNLGFNVGVNPAPVQVCNNQYVSNPR